MKRYKISNRILVVTLIFLLTFSVIGFILANRTRYDTLTIGTHRYRLLEAVTAAEQEKGLGGRGPLPEDQGMIFIYGAEAQRCFWMKGMQFSLDIIWLNAHKDVVAMHQNLSPRSYPQIFCPHESAQYIIELNAGQAAQSGVGVGQKLNF